MASRRSLEWDTTFKRLATILSACAAIISIFSFLVGRQAARHNAQLAIAGMSPIEVDRIEVSPTADTLYSLGDTLHFVTIAADAHGQALHAAAVHWISDDPAIVQIDSTGQAVTRGAGVTSVTVAIGGRAGRARIWVLPKPTALGIEGDSLIRIAEGTTLPLHAVTRDARGNAIPPGAFGWGTTDAEIAVMDSAGSLHGIAPGLTTVTVSGNGLVAERRVEVVPVAASMTLTAGADQRATAGERLGDPVVVQVVSRSGRPVADAVVHFTPALGAGQIVPDSASADSHGLVSVRWTLGPVPGRQRMAAQVAGIDSALVVTAEADPSPRNTRIRVVSDSIAVEAGTTPPEPVVVRVTDSSGVALADLPVSWTVLNGGTLSMASTRTDSTGEARARWRLGPRSGRQRVTVQLGNPRTLPPFTLTARALPGAVAALKVVSGDAQHGRVGAPLTKGVLLRVSDSLGNPVGGVAIHLLSKSGNLDSLVHSGADGLASVRWTMGDTAGPARLLAQIDARDEIVTVTAIAEPGAPAAIAFTAPAGGTAGKTLGRPVQVVVKDRFGNRVPGVTVGFFVTAGKAVPFTGVTDSTGAVLTKWTLGPKSGRQVITALLKGPSLRASHAVTAAATGTLATTTGMKSQAPKPAAASPATKTTEVKPKPGQKSGAPSGSDSARKPFGVP